LSGVLVWFFRSAIPPPDVRFDQLMAEVEGPPIAIEKELTPGMTRAEVRRLLGAPDVDELLPHYNPRLIRRCDYTSLGLQLWFHEEKGLAEMEVSRRWRQPTLGVHIGDPVDDPDIRVRPDTGTKTLRCDSWPKVWFAYHAVSLPEGKQHLERVRVYQIHFRDDAVFGNWDLQLKLPQGN
jgi:hypothetical protein